MFDALKKWLHSKRNVANAFAVAFAALQAGMDTQLIPAEYQVTIITVVNLMLGTFAQGTGWPKLRPAVGIMLLAVGLSCFGMTGCAGVEHRTSKMVSTVEISTSTAEAGFDMAEAACQEAVLPPDTCQTIDELWHIYFDASNAAIDAAEAIIQASDIEGGAEADFTADPDYQAAMRKAVDAWLQIQRILVANEVVKPDPITLGGDGQ